MCGIDSKFAIFIKQWAIAQASCSKSTDFGRWEILRKSPQPIPYAVRIPLAIMWAIFLGSLGNPKSAIFKTMGYGPGFLLKIGPLQIYLKSTRTIPQAVSNPFSSTQRRRFSEFGAICGTYQNPPCSQKHGLQPGPGFFTARLG